MLNVYDVKAERWFDSMKFVSEYYNIPASKIKASLDQGEVMIGNKAYEFSTTGVKLNPKDRFIKEHQLKHMITNFWMSPSGKVWLWAKSKKKWFEWNVSKFDNGNRAFKATIMDKGRRYNKWIRADVYQKHLFPEVI